MTTKKFWSILRIAFYMIRKGFVSKQKLMLDMNLMMKRSKIVGKSIGKIMFLHHSNSPTIASSGRVIGIHEYEYSCTNSPNPVFFHVKSKRKHSYFPCMGATATDENDNDPCSVTVLPRIDYSPQCTHNMSEFAPSPFSVRVSNFSMAEEGDGLSSEVDDKAEEFIKRFYQQLHAQGKIAMAQIQEDEYQEMLARGV